MGVNFISSPATADSDNVLSSCSTCEAGYEVSSACTENSDTVCTLTLVDGCTDDTACNFNASANNDDGSCTFAAQYLDCSGACLNDADGDAVCD